MCVHTCPSVGDDLGCNPGLVKQQSQDWGHVVESAVCTEVFPQSHVV